MSSDIVRFCSVGLVDNMRSDTSRKMYPGLNAAELAEGIDGNGLLWNLGSSVRNVDGIFYTEYRQQSLLVS